MNQARQKHQAIRVLHVCKVYWPVKGGVQVVVEWICRGIKGFDFSILSTSRSPSQAESPGYARLMLAKAFGELLSLPIAPGILTRLWRQFCAQDIVAIHYPFPLADIAVALYPGRLPKLIVYYHSEVVSQKLTVKLINPFTRLMLKRADVVVCSSPNVLEHSRLLRGVKAKCQVIPFGLDIAQDVDSFIKPSQCDYFLTIGRHVPYKGFDILIRAYAQANTTSRLKIVGSGPLLDAHRQLAIELGVQDSVDFIVGASDEEVQELLVRTRCFVLASTMPSEAFGLVQIEAMSLARPVINTSLKSGVPWVARHDQEAITVEPSNVDQLAAALKQMDASDDLVDERGSKALDRARQEFDRQVFFQRTENLFQQLIQERSI